MMHVHSFPPIADGGAGRLILGSMPGKVSLAAQQYYAHPRNLFWPIVEEIFGIQRQLPYELRCEALMRRGIALWDVLNACTRSSSLDADIDADSIVANDFQDFLRSHPHLIGIYFNGATAAKVFERQVLPTLPNEMAAIPRIRLPSTSPANAATPYEVKLQSWTAIRDGA